MDSVHLLNIITTFLIFSFMLTVEGRKIPKISISFPNIGIPSDPSNINEDFPYRVFYQTGKSPDDLPECAPSAVCNKVDVYDVPWVERQCRCSGNTACSSSLDAQDGFTITEKTSQYKLCEPVKLLPTCRYFRDITWTYVTHSNNATQQIVNCVCPKNSVAYIIKRAAHQSGDGDVGFIYSFACSPESRLRCQRKEPCRLFTVKKKETHQEVNPSTLCKCPHNHHCPAHHLNPGVIPGKKYTEDAIRTFSAYCIQNSGL